MLKFRNSMLSSFILNLPLSTENTDFYGHNLCHLLYLFIDIMKIICVGIMGLDYKNVLINYLSHVYV